MARDATRVPSGAIVDFYTGEGQDSARRTIDEIWTWDRKRLESTHDYIQWLFPTRTKSTFHPEAPVLNDAQVRRFRESSELQQRVVRSLDLMLDFYGLRRSTRADGALQIVPSAEFSSRSDWLQRGDHNHLRLTRIITSLRLVGLATHSRALYDCVNTLGRTEPNGISRETLEYWASAARR
jgi:hypothetical protein